MSIKISVENYNKIHELCDELGIDSDRYNSIKGDLAAGRILAPIPADYMEGGKYDCR